MRSLIASGMREIEDGRFSDFDRGLLVGQMIFATAHFRVSPDLILESDKVRDLMREIANSRMRT